MKIINTDAIGPDEIPDQFARDQVMINYRNGRPYVPCIIEGCKKITSSKHGMCTSHYKQRWYLNSVGREEKIIRTSQERWVHSVFGYVMIKVQGKLVYEHRILAEKALGKPLPPKAIVHHMKAADDNHGYCKLVICPDQEYHMLIHKRMEACGL